MNPQSEQEELEKLIEKEFDKRGEYFKAEIPNVVTVILEKYVRRDRVVDLIMEKMPLEWRYHWCDSIVCNCMDCVNRAGNFPLSKQDWEEWVKRNPEVITKGE